MARTMKALTAGLLSAACMFACLYRFFPLGALLAAGITCGTAGYHFGMRLLVGAVFDRAAPVQDPAKHWYRLRPWEEKLYKRLKVKAWKNRLPTYAPDSFSPRLHSWEEIVEASCHSELIHEANCLLSFLPLFAAIWFGDLPVFLITSLLAGVFDLLFVIVQRYNRSRIDRILRKMERRP